MTIHPLIPRRRSRACKPIIIALHCSGSTGRQWRKLAQALGDSFTLIAPDLMGRGVRSFWHRDRGFRLADEAAPIIEIVDVADCPVHLVGHSYGGGVALRIARERPDRVASMSLYEPSAFHVLRAAGPDGYAALAEIRAVASDVAQGVHSGDYRAAARRFVDYWNCGGTWDGVKPETQAELIRYVPKAILEFSALIEEPTSLVAYRRIAVPVLLMRGEHTLRPTELIAQKLFTVFRAALIEEIPGAGHMGPFSHADVVSNKIAAHIAAVAGYELSALPKTLSQPIEGRAVA